MRLHLVGETDATGVKTEGSTIEQKTHEVEIRCRLSKHLDHAEVDVSSLAVGGAIHISDLPAIEGVEYLGAPVQVIVSCQPPTVAVAATEDAGAVAADEVPASKVKGDSE